MSKLTVAIIGFGRAGKRFYQALTSAPANELYEIVAIVDANATAISRTNAIPSYSCIEQALLEHKPSTLVLSVNEEQHYEVLEKVVKFSSIKSIICEKPLTTTLEELLKIKPLLSPIKTTVNFCERYSRIVEDGLTWLKAHAPTVTRIEFSWGKYRIKDPRPTMGVLSEISHALDLSFIFSLQHEPTFKVVSANTTHSDFSISGDRIDDSISLLALINDIPLVGRSSFVLPYRERVFILYARSADGRDTYQLQFNFDNPRWDDDQLTVYKIAPLGGKREVLLSKNYRSDELDTSLRHIKKLSDYLVDVWNASHQPEHVHKYADFNDAELIQVALAELDASSVSMERLQLFRELA